MSMAGCVEQSRAHTPVLTTLAQAAKSAGELSQPRKVKVWAERETRGWKHGPGHCLERERDS